MNRSSPRAARLLETVATCRVRRWKDGRSQAAEDAVAVEEPLEIRVETRSIAVVMRTPGHDEELAVGFLVSEGILRDVSELRAIRPHPRNRAGNILDVFLADGSAVDVARLTRHVFASSSCGLCGVATIGAVRRQFPKITDRHRISAASLLAMPERLRPFQSAFASTGGLHAAAVLDRNGALLALREDVGRHNAVDKVVGRLVLDRRLPEPGSVLWVSGRASFELVQKALAARIPILAAVGAPSSLAVEFAKASGQTLIGFLRDGRFNVYAGPGRIVR